jgi:hypothetical protein
VSGYLSGTRLPPIDRFDELVRLLGADARESGALAAARDRVADPAGATIGPEPAAGGRGVPRTLPAPVSRFVGRAEQIAALDSLVDGEATAAVCAVTGMAGVGKTALAVRWAYRVAARFPDGQHYVDLNGFGPGPPRSTFEAAGVLLTGLGVRAETLSATEQGRVALYRDLLAGRRLLVVLDNVESAGQVASLVPPEPGLALVTSRATLPELGGGLVGVDVLSTADAVTLLSLLIGGRAAREPVAVEGLARHCGYLPLALRIAAEQVAFRPAARLSDVVQELDGDVLGGLTAWDAVGDERANLRTVFSWSLRRLPADARRAFHLLGAAPGGGVDIDTLAALTGTRPHDARRLAQTLARAHLIEPAGAGRFGMHELLRAYAALDGGSTRGGRRGP